MAAKKRGSDVKAKEEETKRKKKSREEDDEDEEDDEEEEDSDDDEDDEEDEKPVKKKKKEKEDKKKKKKSKKDDDEEEDEDEDDEVYTGAYVKKMMRDPNQIPAGNYEFEIKKVRLVKGTKEKPWGGYFVTVKVVEPPEDVDVPDDGWPSNLEIRFSTHVHKSMLKKDEKYAGSVRMNKSNFSRLLAAALGEIDDDEEYDISELKGNSFIAEIVHKDGYQNFRNFRPVEG